MRWAELSEPERYALLGGGLSLLGVVGFGVWFSVQSRKVRYLTYELPPADRERLRQRVSCDNDRIVRAAAEYSLKSAMKAGYNTDDTEDQLVARLYRHIDLDPPTHPCPVTS
jgi:hypothetical protein